MEPGTLNYYDRVHRASLSASIAFDTEIGDHLMLFVRLEQDGFGRTFLGTLGTADAQIIDLVFNKALAFARRTLAIDVRHIFVAEISQCRQNRVWR